MKEFPVIETERMRLRGFKIEDTDRYFEYVSDDILKRQYGFDYTFENASKRVENMVKLYEEDEKPYVWVIADKETDEFMGILSAYNVLVYNGSLELAIGLLEEARGKGIAYEVTVALIDYLFANGFRRIDFAHSVDNTVSEKIIKRFGAVYEGCAREAKRFGDEYVDQKKYGLLKKEYSG